jgi:hypothetical protein
MGCLPIIRMEDAKTILLNPNPKPDIVDNAEASRKEFVYDHSYWSVDPNDAQFVTQQQIYTDLGTQVVDAAFQGYNACIFAYGQTGSGKTYTMMGQQDDEGLIPRICRELFCRMNAQSSGVCSFRTELSYLEIYNERVKDLLDSLGSSTSGQTLRVREHPKNGPYVQGLSRHLVSNFSDVQELMTRGNANRSTASTKMNDSSSRSHAILTITFSQAVFDADRTPRETQSKLHLVDLAGSERADATGTSGQRLVEGGHINKSLVTLGSVIKALASASNCTASAGTPSLPAGSAASNGISATNKPKVSVFVPYRDSVLTWLLKDSLGGNSITIMVATISPADANYSETLSTLRYSSRAKDIVNRPTVNEDCNTKTIRDLRSEIERLKNLLSEHPAMWERVQENEAKVRLLTEEWADKWKETQRVLSEQRTLGLRKAGIGVVLDSDRPHLIALDEGVLSTGVTLYHLRAGITCLGSTVSLLTAESNVDLQTEPETSSVSEKIDKDGSERSETSSPALDINSAEQLSETTVQKVKLNDEPPDILLFGPDVYRRHCEIELDDESRAWLLPAEGARCYVNTVQVDQRCALSHGCVLLFGRCNMFRFNDPQQARRLRSDSGRNKPLSCASCGNWIATGQADEASPTFNAQRMLDSTGSTDLESELNDNDEELPQAARCLNCSLAQSHLLRAASFGNSADSVWSSLANCAPVDCSDGDLDEKRRELEELEEEHRRAEQRRREEAEEADRLLKNKRTELHQLKAESEHWSELVEQSAQRKQQAEAELRVLSEECERLRSEHAFLIDERELSSIDLNDRTVSTNPNPSPDPETKSESPENENCSKQDEESHPTETTQDEIQSFSQAVDLKNAELNSLLREFASRFNLSSSGRPSARGESLVEQFSRQCEQQLVAEVEHMQLAERLERLAMDRKNQMSHFEGQLQHLERALGQQQQLFELQRNKELDAIENERFALQQMEQQAALEVLVEREVRRRLRQRSDWRKDVDTRGTECYMRLTGSPSPAGSPPTARRPLPLPRADSVGQQIQVAVPSFVLRASQSDAHFEYEVHIQLPISEDEFSVFRRFRRFRELHVHLLRTYGSLVSLPPFPPRRLLGNRSERLAEQRRLALETYLQAVVHLFQRVPGCPLNWAAAGAASLTRSHLTNFSSFFNAFFPDGAHLTA